jgi:hypothetical protein
MLLTGKMLAAGGAAAAIGGSLYALLVRGALTLDLRIGRSLQPLGPITVRIAAPRPVVFDVIAAPYVERPPHAFEHKLRVLERSRDMVLAEHFTPVGPLVTTTLETVRFERPTSIHFRLARGPVPHVVERFELRELERATELVYEGELGTDLWALGRLWGGRVARRWEDAVRSSLATVKAEAERRATRHADRH